MNLIKINLEQADEELVKIGKMIYGANSNIEAYDGCVCVNRFTDEYNVAKDIKKLDSDGICIEGIVLFLMEIVSDSKTKKDYGLYSVYRYKVNMKEDLTEDVNEKIMQVVNSFNR